MNKNGFMLNNVYYMDEEEIFYIKMLMYIISIVIINKYNKL